MVTIGTKQTFNSLCDKKLTNKRYERFDTEIVRYNTNSLKYDFKIEKNKPVYFGAVAMDFKCCEEILSDMQKNRAWYFWIH